MIKHSALLDVLRAVRINEDESRKQFKSRQLDREDLLGFEFRSGEEVKDRETGQKGVVLYVERKRVTQVQGSEGEGPGSDSS